MTFVLRRSDRSRAATGGDPSVVIDGYDHLEPIGRGGFSQVYSARQRDFNRRVAIKVLSFGLADERERRSFERECRAMGLVSQHPHIVTVFNSAFTASKQPCIVMELYSGGTMTDRQRREGQLTVATVLEVGVKIAGALQTAHDRGLLHRDIKPQNLFISEFGEPALGDFGISTLDDERSISGGGGLTVHYAPPEVLEGYDATAISDVYSFAATLYTLLEGVRPFTAGPDRKQSVGELARRIMLEDPPRPSRADVPRSLAELLARTMAKEPGARPASAAAFGHELQRIQGELGLPVTTLPVAGSPAGVPSVAPPPPPPWPPSPAAPAATPGAVAAGAPPPPVPVTSAAVAPEMPAPEVRLRSPDHDGDDEGHTITVGRARVGDVAVDEERGTGHPSTKRVVLGTAAALVALAGVAAALLLGGGGGGADPVETTAPPTATEIVAGPELGMVPPQGVTVQVAEDRMSLTVAWNPPVGPTEIARYTVKRVDDVGGAYDTPDGTTYSLVVEMEEGVPDRVCFAVFAVATSGAISDDSALACT